MPTNFFSTLAGLQQEGKWIIVIEVQKEQKMVLSMMFQNSNVNSAAQHRIIPLTMEGMPSELDADWFLTIQRPAKDTVGILSNMELYAKAQEAAKAKHKQEQEKHTVSKKEPDAASKKYEAQMKKVSELEAAGKYREAYAQVPDAAEFLQHEEQINEKKDELKEKFNKPSLF